MKSNQLKIVGAIPIGIYLYRLFTQKNPTDKEIAINNSLAVIGMGIIIYSFTK